MFSSLPKYGKLTYTSPSVQVKEGDVDGKVIYRVLDTFYYIPNYTICNTNILYDHWHYFIQDTHGSNSSFATMCISVMEMGPIARDFTIENSACNKKINIQDKFNSIVECRKYKNSDLEIIIKSLPSEGTLTCNNEDVALEKGATCSLNHFIYYNLADCESKVGTSNMFSQLLMI